MNWSGAAGAGGAGRVDRLQASPFTAQTPLAASYGLLQVTYLRAVERAWTGADGPKNPSALFDTPANVAAGSNSLLFGTREVRRVLVRSARQAGVSVPPTAPGGLIPLLLSGWAGFNPGERDYGAIIALKAETLRPAPQASILGAP